MYSNVTTIFQLPPFLLSINIVINFANLSPMEITIDGSIFLWTEKQSIRVFLSQYKLRNQRKIEIARVKRELFELLIKRKMKK